MITNVYIIQAYDSIMRGTFALGLLIICETIKTSRFY